MAMMDTDGDSSLDQQLLQQFRCLGTTDKDELVKQLQMLVGNHIGTASAIFLLDMNNWNLQAAVGSYFDFEIPLKLPTMSLVRDEQNSYIFKITPSTAIDKVWVLLNDGEEDWPHGCYLQFCGGDTMSDYQKMPVPSLSPNQTTQILIHLVSPKTPGVYKSEWRLVTGTGTYFGDTIWVIMTVIEDDTTNLVKKLSDLNTYSESSTSSNYSLEPDSIQNPFGMHP